MTTINDYARAVAEAVRGELRRAYYGSVQPWYEIDIDAIIASVPAPDVQAQVTQAELDRYWDEWKARFVAEHQAAIDAAVARERGRWVEAINLMVTNEQVREVIIRGVDRARSGAQGQS
jgi:hypothetical protein